MSSTPPSWLQSSPGDIDDQVTATVEVGDVPDVLVATAGHQATNLPGGHSPEMSTNDPSTHAGIWTVDLSEPGPTLE